MMDIFLRSIAILIEVALLIAIFYYIFNGVRLILFDMGIKQKYSKVITMALLTVGCVLATFLISHLITFYPAI